MDLDWTLIEYRPGRYAKVARDGAFLGTASEAEIRAWFARSARPSGQETAPPRPDGARAQPGSFEPQGLVPKPGKVAPEHEEDWEKPLIWAPSRPDRERQTPGPATTPPDPEADEPTSQAPSREVRSSQRDTEVAWAKPMLWGRPPADPRRQAAGAELPSLTAETEAAAPGAASSKALQPDPEPIPTQADQVKAAPEKPAPDLAARPKAGPSAGDKAVAADAGALEPAAPTTQEGGEPEPVQAQLDFTLTEADGPGARGPAAVQVSMDLAGLDPITPGSPEPEPGPDAAEPHAAGPEPAGRAAEETGTEAGDLDEPPDILASEQDLPEPESEPAQEDAAALALEPLEAEETGAEPEDLDQAPEIVTVEPDLPEPEAEPGQEDAAALAPPLLDAEETGAEPEDLDEEPDLPEPELEPAQEVLAAPVPVQDKAEEDWLEEEILEDVTGEEQDEFEPEPGILGPPPTLAPGAVSAGAALDRDELGPLAQDFDLEAPDAGGLWLWVDPRYEAGYSPATFDLTAFLQRATALFQSKAWTRGKKPGRIAVHSDDAVQGLEAVAERLELVVVEDARVSNGTYWLGLEASGEPAETLSS